MSTPLKRENFMRQFRQKVHSQDDSTEITELTSAQLLAIWNHYDKDGSGYLESDELDEFLEEFVTSVCSSDDIGAEVVSPTMMAEMKRDLMDAYDENEDGKIEIRELTQLLPTDENFLLLFQLDNRLESSTDFMKIWNQYDEDKSGFIEGQELKDFLRDLLAKAKPDELISSEKIDEYASSILKIFDDNGDGKLQLSEMSRLLPLKDNVLSTTLQNKIFHGTTNITYADIERIFAAYDTDGSGTIESDELKGFVKDLLSQMKPNYTLKDVEAFENMLMKSCDLDGDGKICREELTIMLLGLQKYKK